MFKIETKVDFNFHKITGAAFDMNIMASLKNIAKYALKKVQDTFKTGKDILGNKFAPSTALYLQMKHNFKQSKIKTNKVMIDTGRLKDSFVAQGSTKDLAYSVGSPLQEEYYKHLNGKIAGVKRGEGTYPGFRGDYTLIPQRKFFYSSDDEAYELLETKIEEQVDEFFDELIKDLSTSMRKL